MTGDSPTERYIDWFDDLGFNQKLIVFGILSFMGIVCFLIWFSVGIEINSYYYWWRNVIGDNWAFVGIILILGMIFGICYGCCSLSNILNHKEPNEEKYSKPTTQYKY